MKKIPTIWKRDPANPRRVVPNDWTDGVDDDHLAKADATVKWDGTCLLYDEDGQWWARRTVKKGKPEPANWIWADTDGDKRQGWEPLAQSSFADIFASVAVFERRHVGTYELVGPKINGNPHRLTEHLVIPHGEKYLGHLSAVQGLLALNDESAEGIVWWLDGEPYAKLKRTDVGLPWPPKGE